MMRSQCKCKSPPQKKVTAAAARLIQFRVRKPAWVGARQGHAPPAAHGSRWPALGHCPGGHGVRAEEVVGGHDGSTGQQPYCPGDVAAAGPGGPHAIGPKPLVVGQGAWRPSSAAGTAPSGTTYVIMLHSFRQARCAAVVCPFLVVTVVYIACTQPLLVCPLHVVVFFG